MSETVKGLTCHEILVAFSSVSKEAFVHIHYDQVDERNHKSLNTLVHVLNESGFSNFGTIIENQQSYAVFENALEALKAYQFVNDHSAAVNSSLYYKGVQNKEAEDAIHKDFPKIEEKHGFHHHSTKH